PDYNVLPVYSGTYQETIVKVLTAHKSGKPPAAAILLSTDTFTLADEDAIIPIDNFVKTDEDRAWMKSFFPAFMLNSQFGNKTWGVPFQRSTVVLYWNKEAFKEAGLDPNKPPKTWDETVSMGQKLTKKDAAGNVTQWGIQVPSSGFPYWLFQGFSTQNDAILANADGNQVKYDAPNVIGALQYWVDLSRKYGIHPPGVVEWGTTPRDFMEKKVAMIWTTTGNLTNIRANAKFDFGVAMLPAGKKPGSPTGGGNFFIFKKVSPAEQEGSFKFAKWLTQPARAAQWSIDTGYVAVAPASYETEALKKYAADFPPALVARDQLEFAVAELSTHDNQRVTKALNDGLQAALTGGKTPEQAMKDAQVEATRLLRPYQ
ncbi:MAG: ABC transporter substrate-binding protein, partial [Burkholderiales bacterium]